eukprot:6442299-Amphidinium_carterae.1
MLGYSALLVTPQLQTYRFYEELIDGTFDVSIEQWLTDVNGAEYIKHVETDKSIHHIGYIGYIGRSGLHYTNQNEVGKDPNAAYYKFYQNTTRAIDSGFTTHAESEAPQLASQFGHDWPICTSSFLEWCGTGEFDGYWATPLTSAPMP